MGGVIQPFNYTEIPINKSQCKDECIYTHAVYIRKLFMETEQLSCIYDYVGMFHCLPLHTADVVTIGTYMYA